MAPRVRRVRRVRRVPRVRRVRSPIYRAGGGVEPAEIDPTTGGLTMRILGYSGREFLRIGLGAVVFILALKWLAPKTGIAALNATVDKV
jgi:hypothetical protein